MKAGMNHMDAKPDFVLLHRKLNLDIHFLFFVTDLNILFENPQYYWPYWYFE